MVGLCVIFMSSAKKAEPTKMLFADTRGPKAAHTSWGSKLD